MTAEIGESSFGEAAINESSGGWDRTLLNISSWMTEPICFIYSQLRYRITLPLDPEKFNNSASKVKEVALRAFIVCSAIFSVFLISLAPLPILGTLAIYGIVGKIFRFLGYALQKNGFTHVRGNAPEVPVADHVKIMAWNIAGISGGMHLDHAGVNHWRDRIDGIIHKIEEMEERGEEIPGVLFFEEIYDTALAEEITRRLSGRYAHIFTHLGAGTWSERFKMTWGSEGGVMVLTRHPVESFKSTSFVNNTWQINRTFATLKVKGGNQTPVAAIIGTHLIHNSEANRAVQLRQIVNSIKKEELKIPTVIAGDLNIERDGPESGVLADFEHSFKVGTPSHPCAHPADKFTATNKLIQQWDPKAHGLPSQDSETIDYISLFRKNGGSLDEAHLVHAFEYNNPDPKKNYNTKTSLSDHHGIVTVLRLGAIRV